MVLVFANMYQPYLKKIYFRWNFNRDGPIYRLGDIFGQYRYRYPYIGTGFDSIGMGYYSQGYGPSMGFDPSMSL